MRKILKNVPVAGPRFSLRAGAPAESAIPHAPRTAAPRVEPPVPTEAPVVDERLIQQWRQAAERQGHEAGYKAGAAEMRAQAEQELARLAALCESLKQAHREQMQQWQDFAVEFAFTVATRVLGAAAPGREGIQGMVAAALSQTRDAAVMSVRVHPSDVAWVCELIAGRPEFADGDPVKVMADHQVAQGGCMLDTTQGTLDARLDVQLRALKDAMLAAYALTPMDPAR